MLSAASQRQVAYETWDVDGKTKVGSLSYAIARTLPMAALGTIYRALFAEITRSLSGKVMQTPQRVSLSAGALAGINPGTRVVRRRTADRSRNDPLDHDPCAAEVTREAESTRRKRAPRRRRTYLPGPLSLSVSP